MLHCMERTGLGIVEVLSSPYRARGGPLLTAGRPAVPGRTRVSMPEIKSFNPPPPPSAAARLAARVIPAVGVVGLPGGLFAAGCATIGVDQTTLLAAVLVGV